MFPLKIIVCHSRATCLIRIRRCLIFHLLHFLNAHTSLHLTSHSDEQPHDPRTAERSGRLEYKVHSQVLSPTPSLRSAAQRLLLFTMHQGGQVVAQHTVLVRTPQLQLCLRKWMKDKASEGWLHRWSCRRENQMHSLQEFITRLEKVPCQAHLTFEAQGDPVAIYPHKRKSSRDQEA